eukprot:jgi/Mesvir1/718/Mv17326-RA.2
MHVRVCVCVSLCVCVCVRVRALPLVVPLLTCPSLPARQVVIYDDEDGARRDEIALLGGKGVFSSFYDRLRELKDYHRRHPSAVTPDPAQELEHFLTDEPKIEFSGEELYGRHLDLHELYHLFINGKFGKVVEYGTFLELLPHFEALPRRHKITSPYEEYLSHLNGYLRSFHDRTQPLADTDALMQAAEREFEDKWAAGEVPGWEDQGTLGPRGGAVARPDADAEAVLNLDEFESVEELEAVGGDKLKEALVALHLKCGGTVSQRAERLWQTKGKRLEELDPKLFAKGAPLPQAVAAPQEPVPQKYLDQARSVAQKEMLARMWLRTLDEALERTRGNVEQKQSRTVEEMEAEVEAAEEEEAVASDSDDDDKPIYNPLKLPLGPDGKPIPYWLYKLHGLNQEFLCEICGDVTYRGRREFERHFRESTHQKAMRALGIPNTKLFHEVTVIADALELWEQVKARNEGGQWKPEVDEEFEDADGNVYDKKTYSYLQKEGLV